MEVVAFHRRGGLLETDVVKTRKARTIYILNNSCRTLVSLLGIVSTGNELIGI
jgi:hypothetical protein